MKLLPIVIYPDPVLNRVAEPVTEFDSRLREFTEDMIYTMLAAPGAGLAAPQVGVSKRLFMVNGEYFEKPKTGLAVINPRLISASGSVVAEEGCLSLPDQYGDVERAENIVMEYQDVGGNLIQAEWTGWPARIFLHELDHLNGIMFFERMTGLRKQMFLKRMKRMVKSGKYPAKA